MKLSWRAQYHRNFHHLYLFRKITFAGLSFINLNKSSFGRRTDLTCISNKKRQGTRYLESVCDPSLPGWSPCFPTFFPPQRLMLLDIFLAKLFENWQWNRNKLFYIEINSAKPNDIPRILGVSIAMSNMAKQDLSQNPKTIKQMAWGILQAAWNNESCRNLCFVWTFLIPSHCLRDRFPIALLSPENPNSTTVTEDSKLGTK